MRSRLLLLASLSLGVTPLAAQGLDTALVGTWTAHTMGENRATRQQVLLEAVITFEASGRFRSQLHSLDNDGTPGQLPQTVGDWQTVTASWGSHLICVRAQQTPSEVHCQQYTLEAGDLRWGGVTFGRQVPTELPGQQL